MPKIILPERRWCGIFDGGFRWDLGDLYRAVEDVFGDRADMITRRLAEIQVAPAVRFGGQGSMAYADATTEPK